MASFYYLASPFSKYPKGRKQAYKDICIMTDFLEHKGLFVFSPISHSYGIEKHGKDGLKYDYEWRLSKDFYFLEQSRGLIVVKMENWEESFGVQEEIKYAHYLDKPVYYTEFMELPIGW